MTGRNVLIHGVIIDRITNVFNDFSAYLIVFNTLEPIAFKKHERNFMLAPLLFFVYLLPSRIKKGVPILIY